MISSNFVRKHLIDVLYIFLVPLTKYLTKATQRGKGFFHSPIWNSVHQDKVEVVGEMDLWRKEHMLCDNIEFPVKKQRCEFLCSGLLSLALYIKTLHQPIGRCQPNSKMVFITRFKVPETPYTHVDNKMSVTCVYWELDTHTFFKLST